MPSITPLSRDGQREVEPNRALPFLGRCHHNFSQCDNKLYCLESHQWTNGRAGRSGEPSDSALIWSHLPARSGLGDYFLKNFWD